MSEMAALIDEIKEGMSNIRRTLGADGRDEPVMRTWGSKPALDFTYRNWNFFTRRRDVEDDDQPMFTGKERIELIVEGQLKHLYPKIKISITDHEKAWYTVFVMILVE